MLKACTYRIRAQEDGQADEPLNSVSTLMGGSYDNESLKEATVLRMKVSTSHQRIGLHS